MASPKCPNHQCSMQATADRRIFICPISGARFECDVETQEKDIKFDKYGKPLVEWKLTPLDGDGG